MSFIPGKGRLGEEAIHDENVVACLIGGLGFRDVVEDVTEFDQEGIRVHGSKLVDHVAHFSLLLFPCIVIGEGVDDVCDGMAEVLREGFISDAAVFYRVVEVSGGNEFRPVRATGDEGSDSFDMGVVGGARKFSGLTFMGLPGEGGGAFGEPVCIAPDNAVHEEKSGFAGWHGSVEPAEDGEARNAKYSRRFFNGGSFPDVECLFYPVNELFRSDHVSMSAPVCDATISFWT